MGIHIAFTDAEALIERCDVAGVRLTADEPGWEDGSVVPLDDWRPLTAQQAAELRADATTDPNTVVEIVEVPIDRAAAHAIMPVTAGDFDPFAGRHDADFLGYLDQDPGLRTGTIDESQNLRIGIHLDNFDKLSFAERTTGRRRLGVNFGLGTRHLLLATIDVLDVCLANDPNRPSQYPHTDDLRRYVRDGHPLTVLRIRLDPGQGYIAPTELVPHDGSTLTATTPSRIAFWLGHWPVGTLPRIV
ncbi:MAG: hypothetical protein AUG49_23160 [Catenulispora sp. 13_1_20CM_3_70_7]|nr:MAG: hypothetical protein AUG49_23160 [Catenulispora sp. 13_1_20CM_3_70_7]